MNYRFLVLLLIHSSVNFCFGQVGINTTDPQATLDVNGFTKIDEKLYLEEPGDFEEIRGSKLLVEKTDATIVQYDIEASRYGPINYAELKFQNVSNQGVQDYDTGISITDYSVTVQGFYVRGVNGESNVITSSNDGDQFIEGFQVYAHKDFDDETWHIKAFVNNSIFRLGANTNIRVNIFLNLIIYRKGLLTKEGPSYSISAGNTVTVGVLGKPAGF